MSLYEQSQSMFLYQKPTVDGAAPFADAAAPPRDPGVYREAAVSAAVNADVQPTLYRRALYVDEPFVDEPNYYGGAAEPEPERPTPQPAIKKRKRTWTPAPGSRSPCKKIVRSK